MLTIVFCILAAGGQTPLPDPLTMNDGTKVASWETWQRRRAEIVETLLHYEYGTMPPAPGDMKVLSSASESAINGKATLERLILTTGLDDRLRIEVALYVPATRPGPFPVVLAVDSVWLDHFVPVAEKMVERGYILAGFDRHGFDADSADRSDGVHVLYPEYDWGSVAAWAWGTMRIVDFLLTRADVDKAHIAITGHSRAGKVALLAGALDERIALVAPHASGAGGAGSFMIPGPDCETLELITQPERFGYWFCPRLREFVGREASMPFDQHFLKALVAPRALFTLEALGDLWANPYGTNQTRLAAQPVFDLLDAGDRNGVYYREGGHDMTIEDWSVLIDVSDHAFKGASLPTTLGEKPPQR